ncbi:hypothetical protein J2S19_003768 [Metabacillus malikii]|uniref:DUF5071 domain-containing protein n=1 Tax=Metabacillus malikii TaxID=1504265 RepID=A0ABT9ZJM1_9BACI|nr:hypothetical protein [Metabacillus malikii]
MPKNKHDFESLDKLKNLDKERIIPLLPELIVWVQDMNWPISEEVAKILLMYQIEIIPLIKDILRTNDNVWKYWCLETLVKRLDEESKELLKNDLARLSERPTAGERLEQLDVTATEILKTYTKLSS